MTNRWMDRATRPSGAPARTPGAVGPLPRRLPSHRPRADNARAGR